jgi:hypothetical protein
MTMTRRTSYRHGISRQAAWQIHILALALCAGSSALAKRAAQPALATSATASPAAPSTAPDIPGPAATGQAYKCISNGHTTYSQLPCPDVGQQAKTAQARTLVVKDERTAAQANDGRLMMARDTQLAKSLAHQRQKEEHAASQVPAKALTHPVKHRATATSAVAAAHAASASNTTTLKRSRHFRALVPKASAS